MVLKQVCIYCHTAGQQDLKWSGGVITLFSAGVIDTLITLFDKFSDMFLPSWGQQHSLSVANAGIVCTLVNLAVRVSPLYVCVVVKARSRW